MSEATPESERRRAYYAARGQRSRESGYYFNTDAHNAGLEAVALQARAKAFRDVKAHLDSQLSTWSGTEISPEHLLKQVINNLPHLEALE